MSRERIQFMRTATPRYHPGWDGRKCTSWQEEQLSWKQPGYTGDCSSLWAVEVRGSDAHRPVRDSGVEGVAQFPVGQRKHLVLCTTSGKTITDNLLSPYELGWGKSVQFDHEFTGRAATEWVAATPRRTRAKLEFGSDDVVDVYASLFGEGAPSTSWTCLTRSAGSPGQTR